MPSPSPPPADHWRVAVVTRHAVYLERPGRVLAVLTADAAPVPGALVIGARVAGTPFAGVRVGDRAVVSRGRVRLGDTYAGQFRTATTPRPFLDPAVATARSVELADVVAAESQPLPTELRGPLQGLYRALAGGDPAAVSGATRSLLGLGPGLTPSGDDLLCGLLVTWAAFAPRPAAVESLRCTLGETVALEAPRRTSLVSRTFLDQATAGACVPALAGLLEALGRDADVRPAVRRVVALGHTSGSDLLQGVLVATGYERQKTSELFVQCCQ